MGSVSRPRVQLCIPIAFAEYGNDFICVPSSVEKDSGGRSQAEHLLPLVTNDFYHGDEPQWSDSQLLTRNGWHLCGGIFVFRKVIKFLHQGVFWVYNIKNDQLKRFLVQN